MGRNRKSCRYCASAPIKQDRPGIVEAIAIRRIPPTTSTRRYWMMEWLVGAAGADPLPPILYIEVHAEALTL